MFTINLLNGFTKLRKPKFDSLSFLTLSLLCVSLQNAKFWLSNIGIERCIKPAIWRFSAIVSHDGTNLCFNAAGAT